MRKYSRYTIQFVFFTAVVLTCLSVKADQRIAVSRSNANVRGISFTYDEVFPGTVSIRVPSFKNDLRFDGASLEFGNVSRTNQFFKMPLNSEQVEGNIVIECMIDLDTLRQTKLFVRYGARNSEDGLEIVIHPEDFLDASSYFSRSPKENRLGVDVDKVLAFSLSVSLLGNVLLALRLGRKYKSTTVQDGA